MELSKHLRDVSRTIAGKEQMLISAIARALEVIPRQLCDNAGFDSTNILNKLRQKHAQGCSSFVYGKIFIPLQGRRVTIVQSILQASSGSAWTY